MSFYYPKAAMKLRAVFEDYQGKSDPKMQKTYDFTVRPRTVSVSINDYTQADTFNAEIDYKQFPFDPRTLRALAVTIYMENTQDTIVPSLSNTLFIGFADEESIEFNESSRTVKFEGRDFTCLLLDAPYPNRAPSFTLPINTLVEEIVKSLPATAKITVENRTGDLALPTLSQYAPDFNPLGGGAKNVKKDENYWEVIQDVVGRAGLIAYMELDVLVITKPRALFDKNKAIQFVYGKNLSKLSFKRKLGRQKGFNIRMISLPTGEKKPITALIPEEATEAWALSFGIQRKRVTIPKFTHANDKTEADAPFLSFPVPNIKSKDHLITIGEGVFEEIGRQQIEGSFESKDMKQIQFNDQNVKSSYDFLKIRNATPVGIDIEHKDMENMKRISTVDERRNYLKRQNYSFEVADAIATAYGRIDMVFYTKSVEFTLNHDTGFNMKLDFVNYIAAKNAGVTK